MDKPSDKTADEGGGGGTVAAEENSQLSVRFGKDERRRILAGTKALHLKAEGQFVRMAVMRLLDEVESGRIEVRAPRSDT